MQQTVRQRRLVRYHRPTTVPDAIALLAEPGRVAWAGGTTIVHDTTGEPAEVVDLQALGLAGIERDAAGSLRAGATTTLQALADDPATPAAVREAARAELPSTLRTLATVGGTVAAADAHSVLLATLLAFDAEVAFADGRAEPLAAVLDRVPAPDLLDPDLTAPDLLGPDLTVPDLIVPDLIIAVEFATDGRYATASTGRTPADVPIVAAVGRAADDGVRLALSGVAPVPVLVAPDDVDSLEPPSDFRGSSAYRRRLATVLTARVTEDLA